MVRRRQLLRARQSASWFSDLLAHYVDLLKRRRWRLLAGELFALSWSLAVLAAASVPRVASQKARKWLGQDRPSRPRIAPLFWQRRNDIMLTGVSALFSISILLPAAPGLALIQGDTGIETGTEPESLLSLLAEDSSPVFATAGSLDPLVRIAHPQGRSEPMGGITPGGPDVPSLQQLIPPEGLVHVVSAGESLWDICTHYRVKMEDVIGWNGLANPDRLAIGTRLHLPGAKLLDSPVMISPLGAKLPRVTSNYGMRIHPILKRRRFHHGVDFRASRGTPIRAVLPGRVVSAKRNRLLGNYIAIDHGSGLTTRYGHCHKLIVKVGDRVKAGQTIATVGSTGRSTGPHLHFEVWKNGRHTNPITYLKAMRRKRG